MRFGSSALLKAIVVAGVALLLLIPVEMLRNLITERTQMREQAIASVSRGWGGRQMLGGPVLAIPATVAPTDPHERETLHEWYVLPESLELESELVQPVDLYSQAEHSVKYAGLFIALSLLTLFLWEHLAGESLHPIQYGLTGLALSVFYLLLLALAEHIGFAKAYVVAALGLCSLLGVYIAGAFKSTKAGSGSAVAFGTVYGLLYLLITSEDYSLLAGAISLLAILATVMVLTRKLDWYRAGVKSEASVPGSQ